MESLPRSCSLAALLSAATTTETARSRRLAPVDAALAVLDTMLPQWKSAVTQS